MLHVVFGVPTEQLLVKVDDVSVGAVPDVGAVFEHF